MRKTSITPTRNLEIFNFQKRNKVHKQLKYIQIILKGRNFQISFLTNSQRSSMKKKTYNFLHLRNMSEINWEKYKTSIHFFSFRKVVKTSAKHEKSRIRAQMCTQDVKILHRNYFNGFNDMEISISFFIHVVSRLSLIV